MFDVRCSIYDFIFISNFLIPPDFVGGLKDETQSAESATDNRNRGKIDASPERAKEVSLALSGLGSNPILSQGFHPWLLSVALSALWKKYPQNPSGSANLKFNIEHSSSASAVD
jgi:hypothetical protein